MAAGQPTDSLIATLEQRVDAGVAYFQSPGSRARIKLGRWEPRDVLCHLLWWHQATVEGMESVAAGGAPYRIYASVDQMNARAVGRLTNTSIEQMLEMVQQWRIRLVPAARALEPQTVVFIMGDGSERTVQQRLEAMAHHWYEHVQELQALDIA